LTSGEEAGSINFGPARPRDWIGREKIEPRIGTDYHGLQIKRQEQKFLLTAKAQRAQRKTHNWAAIFPDLLPLLSLRPCAFAVQILS
jgi:hypothetical protein